MVVIIKMRENVIDYIASFDDAKMDVNGCNRRRTSPKITRVRFLGLRFYLSKVFFW